MMCEECGKNVASIKLVSVLAGEKHEKLICSECMSKFQKQFRALDLSGLAGILGSLIKQTGGLEDDADNNKVSMSAEGDENGENDDLMCMGCGLTYGEYRKTGFLGCPECYQAFRHPLSQTLKRLNGYTRHIGRVPGNDMCSVSIRLDIDRLRHQLTRAINEEEYEQAADIRDRIKELSAMLSEVEIREGVANE
ncbi:MAG: UvrB/UvrC motif-containing protein [Clostridia bacterium]|nr:UvrB/UvrC motif-containing protein [Clostridia bacterium]